VQAPVVGNDIVDLLHPSTGGKHVDARFLARILDDAERRTLAAAADPGVELWAFWAAKEAAYKVASKLRGTPPVFVHAAFSVAWTAVGGGRRRGRVTYRELVMPVEAWTHGAAVHALSAVGTQMPFARCGIERLGPPPEEWSARLAELMPRFTASEADAVHSFPSAAVRLLARPALAQALGADEADVEIVCEPGVTGRRPPRVLLAGRPAPCDVSLSHHGSWVAWALLAQNPGGR